MEILLGIVILVMLVQRKNAQAPMPDTGKPLIAQGMVTAKLKSVYLVMVIAPLLVT
jgi:hypothetical protein